jgi:hypothetical protein
MDQLIDLDEQFYIRPAQAKRFGFGKSQLYVLMDKGLVKSKMMKLPGNKKGCRLVEVKSLLQFIESLPSK